MNNDFRGAKNDVMETQELLYKQLYDIISNMEIK